MELIQLKYFKAVAKTENISKAAKELFVTQPNLSRSISRLEDEIGVPLFDHRKGKIVLNDYGRIFLSSVNMSLDELEKGVQTIKRLHDSEDNFLHLGSTVNDFLPDLLREFSTQNPDIGIRQIDCSPEDIRLKIADGSIDIGITSVPIEDKECVFQLLGEKELVILTGSSHWLTDHVSVSICDLSDETFICDRSRIDETKLRKICIKYGFEPKILYDVENSDLIYRLLSSNSGICFMPIAQMVKIERDFPDLGIHMVRIREKIPPARLGLVYRKDYIFSNAARKLNSFILEWMKEEHNETERLMKQY